MQELVEKTEPEDRTTVLVYLNDEDGVTQPEHFQMCPLGIQLYFPRSVPDCELMDFRLHVPDEQGDETDVTCTGLVVQCVHDTRREAYRIWVKFLDLEPRAQKRLQHTCHKNGHFCPFCENFR